MASHNKPCRDKDKFLNKINKKYYGVAVKKKMKKNPNLIQKASTQSNLIEFSTKIEGSKVKDVNIPNIFKQNVKNNLKLRPFNEIISDVGDIQYFPAWAKEWRNSVYHYNSNLIKNFPIYDINIVKIIKVYFGTYFNHQFLKYKHILTRKRRLSFNKIFFARPEIKHTNSKAIITLYTFNREKFAILKKIGILSNLTKHLLCLLKTRGFFIFRKKKLKFSGGKAAVQRNGQINLEWKWGNVREFCKGHLKIIENIFFKFNMISLIMKDGKVLQDYYTYFSALNISKIKAKKETNKWVKILLKREFRLLRKYKFKLNLNKYKFEEKFLYRLSNVISKIYNKQIEFNIVNLKNIVFNTDLFTEISTKKIKKRNTRVLKIMNIMLNKAKLPRVNRIQEKGRIVKNVNLNLVENKYRTLNLKDILTSKLNLDKLLTNLYTSVVNDEFLPQVKANLNDIVFNSIKYKNMAGIRMEVKGRLTPRYRADRSVYRLRWKGGLKNIDSSYKGLSVRKNRGHINPNVSYSIFSSKRRVGAFAVKGWMSGKSYSTLTATPNKEDLSTSLNPWVVTGLVDAEGSFNITVVKNNNSKLGWVTKLRLEMSMLKKDRFTLEQLINYFGGGGIRVLDDNNLRFYIESLKDLTTVINHFDKYPLFTKKQEDYLLFKQVFELFKNKNHLTMEGLRQIVAIKALLRNKGLSNSLLEAFPGITPATLPITDTITFGVDKSILSPWLAGFTSGDGNFYISIGEGPKHVQVQLVFTLTQHIRDQALMNSLISYLGCGNIKHNEKNSWLQFIVTKFSDIDEKIIPIFKENKILGEKFKDFQDWCRAAELMKNKAHLTPSGLEEIRKLKAGMNRGR
uniref:LAGLIDADG endonuclease n=1 Tax=Cryphonectria parasitica TaxID=5116 RepID=A0A191MXB5_CRYPA|nr:S5 ribosomal protein/maturase fusion protein [Cryphonectria parasitica]AMX22315.1 LAGLIDADG endonuclease [Cryphonectria parasitica]